MIDIKLIRENRKTVEAGLAKRGVTFDLDRVLSADDSRKKLQLKLESMQAEKNKAAKEFINLTKAKQQTLKKKMQAQEKTFASFKKDFDKAEKEFINLMAALPNLPLDSVPAGDETKSEVIKKVGEPKKFDFPVRDHVELGKINDIIDIERAAKISGARFYYLKNEAALLEFALTQFVLQKLVSKSFTPLIPPILVKERAMFGTGYFPADLNEIYHVNPQEDDLYLVGTAEVPLISYHADETLAEKELPKRYCGFSTCLRREAGSYGKDTKGIFRAHQFDKVEMVSFADPEKSLAEHEFLLSIEEEIIGGLGLPYQVVNIAAGDLGSSAAKKYDIEVWFPSEKKYRELTSCSNTIDYQARRLNIRAEKSSGKVLAHTLNGTACAIGRTLVAIMENYQQKDGSIDIPEILKPYMGEVHKLLK